MTSNDTVSQRQIKGRSRTFRSLFAVAGALLLMAALAPRANATLIAYFNFEGPNAGNPPNFMSQVPPGLVTTTITTNYDTARMSSVSPGLALNVAAGDPDPNLISLGLRSSTPNNGAHFDISLPSPGFYQDMSLSFAIASNGNGFGTVTLQYSTNGGTNFTTFATVSGLVGSGTQLVSAAVPTAANNAPLLVLRIVVTDGHSNGNDLQTQIDNIQVNGTVVPEPATVVGGLLGFLGLCWHQRRRLIRFVRLRRA